MVPIDANIIVETIDETKKNTELQTRVKRKLLVGATTV